MKMIELFPSLPPAKRRALFSLFSDYPELMQSSLRRLEKKKKAIEQKDAEGLRSILEEERTEIEKALENIQRQSMGSIDTGSDNPSPI